MSNASASICAAIVLVRVLCVAMNLSAKGLRALVTAGAAGIGCAIVRTFLEHGAKVHLCDVDEKALASCKEQIPDATRTRDLVRPLLAMAGTFRV
jgi:NAD(P)-dependent dehydrogenase (short-subunit alcohol dehydrogenase family)